MRRVYRLSPKPHRLVFPSADEPGIRLIAIEGADQPSWNRFPTYPQPGIFSLLLQFGK